MDSIENELNSASSTLLSDDELVSIVITKHKTFMKEYTAELENLEYQVEQNRSEHQRLGKELDTLETRIVVLKEKRHQLYHQAKKLRNQLTSSLKEREKVLVLEREMDKIDTILQNTNMSSAEEINHSAQLRSLLTLLTSKVNMDDAQQRTMDSIQDILEIAMSARHELDESVSVPDTLKNKYNSLKKECEEMESRCVWLRRKSRLHREALEYWENIRTGAEQLE